MAAAAGYPENIAQHAYIKVSFEIICLDFNNNPKRLVSVR